MIPKKFENLVFGFFLTCMMTIIVSGISTLIGVGFVSGFHVVWFWSWLSSWVVAFPAVLVVAPFTRRIVARIVQPH